MSFDDFVFLTNESHGCIDGFFVRGHVENSLNLAYSLCINFNSLFHVGHATPQKGVDQRESLVWVYHRFSHIVKNDVVYVAEGLLKKHSTTEKNVNVAARYG